MRENRLIILSLRVELVQLSCFRAAECIGYHGINFVYTSRKSCEPLNTDFNRHMMLAALAHVSPPSFLVRSASS